MVDPVLERRYDGPIPPDDPAAGPPAPRLLLARLLFDGRQEIARRRLRSSPGSPGLEQAVEDVRRYRAGMGTG
jgi:hypothetical protein